MTNQTHEHDVVIVGAGPAGTSAAAILAEQGHDVCILERANFPRYRVGESLIPYCWFPLDRLGMIDKLDKSHFVKKYSVQFVNLDGRISAPFYFFKHTDHDCSRTWQVVRGEFDQMLLDNAIEKGATIRMPCNARDLIRDGDHVVGVKAADDNDQPIEIRAKVTIDASGRDLFAVSRNDWRVNDPKLRKIAMWSYFMGGKRDPGMDEGATTVAYVPDKGWFWYIPLPDNVVSVGVVAEKDYLYSDGQGDPDAIFEREVAKQPWIADHIAPACKMQPVKVTGDYSYRSRHCSDNGLVLAGDAFAFLDPVFSSGVFLALQSGVMAGDAVHNALKAGDVTAPQFADYGKRLCDGIEAMRKLVYVFYEENFSFGKLLKKYPHLHHDLTDCLIGNLEKDFDPLFNAIAEFVEVPKPLTHGIPTAATA